MNLLKERLAALTGDRDPATVIGLAVSAAWLLLMVLFWLFGPAGDGTTSGLARLIGFAAALMPLALIWMAVGLAHAVGALKAEADDLRRGLQMMRSGAPDAPAPSRAPAHDPAVMPRPAAPARTAPAQAPGPASAPAAARAVRPSDIRQTAMRFDQPESVVIAPAEMIIALNFPDGPEDRRAIDAMRAALRDHDSARIIRAAQDVVTLLAGSDIYMDSLATEPAQPAVWRRFAEGGRGGEVADLGGIHDADALDVTAAMLKGDEIFRDAAHHFLRHFDLMVSRMVPELSDAQVMELAQTRSARAFMLLGRAAGVFG